jgi:hypothetical protein
MGNLYNALLSRKASKFEYKYNRLWLNLSLVPIYGTSRFKISVAYLMAFRDPRAMISPVRRDPPINSSVDWSTNSIWVDVMGKAARKAPAQAELRPTSVPCGVTHPLAEPGVGFTPGASQKQRKPYRRAAASTDQPPGRSVRWRPSNASG